MALADAYWGLQDAANAEAAYRRVLTAATNDATGLPPALAYKRLALLSVPTDLAGARDLLIEARRIDPTDPETLFAIGELSFALGELDAAAEGFRAYLATPQGADDGDALARLELVEAIGPATAALEEERSAENLLALADVYWASGAQDPAVEIYFEVLTDHDPAAVVALARTGQLLFVRGRTDDAVGRPRARGRGRGWPRRPGAAGDALPRERVRHPGRRRRRRARLAGARGRRRRRSRRTRHRADRGRRGAPRRGRRGGGRGAPAAPPRARSAAGPAARTPPIPSPSPRPRSTTRSCSSRSARRCTPRTAPCATARPARAAPDRG